MPLRLATFNLESLDWSADEPDWFAARASALRPILDMLDADVLCLQEVNAQRAPGATQRGFHALNALLRGSACEGFHLAHSTRPGSDTPADVHNLVILSRWPVAERRQIHHDLVPAMAWTPLQARDVAPLALTFDRPLLHVRIDPPGQAPLHLVNLHLRAPRAAPLPGARQAGQWSSVGHWAEGYFLAAQKRQGQALEARLFVESLFERDGLARIAVCGDLNAEAYETPTRILEALPDDVECEAFAARALTPLERRVPEARRYSVLHDGRRVLLDHILASPSLAAACREVAILNTGLADEAHVQARVAASLHAPVLVSFA